MKQIFQKAIDFIYVFKAALNENKELKGFLKLKTDEAAGYKEACFQLLDKATVEIVVGKVLNRDLSWFNYHTLPQDEQEAYFKEAQAILNSKVFKNETNAAILDLTEEIAKRSKNFEHVMLLRTKIATIELLRERLSSIANPKKVEPTKEDLYSAI